MYRVVCSGKELQCGGVHTREEFFLGSDYFAVDGNLPLESILQ